jgi:alpha-tubulin suppressor-like RCC1 family protein
LGIGFNINETFIQSSLNLIDVIKITSGDYHNLILTKNNLLFSFGSNNFGQLGLSNNINSFIPTNILINSPNIITQISSGNYHNLILLNDGNVYSFGLNNV